MFAFTEPRQILTLSVNGLKSRRLLPFLTSFLVGINLPVDLLEKKDILGFVHIKCPARITAPFGIRKLEILIGFNSIDRRDTDTSASQMIAIFKA